MVVYAGTASVAGQRTRTGTTIGAEIPILGVEVPAEERLFLEQPPLMGSVDDWPMVTVLHSNSGACLGRHPSSDVVGVG